MSKLSVLRSAWPGLLVMVLVFVADQVSKCWILYGLDLPQKGSVYILPFLNFSMVWNHAVTFGLLGGIASPIVFSGVALVVVCCLLVWMFRTPSRLIVICVGAIIGGAVGNVVDRLYYGAVVDFIHVHAFGYSYYVFNIADSAIVCGVVVLLLNNIRSGIKSQTV